MSITQNWEVGVVKVVHVVEQSKGKFGERARFVVKLKNIINCNYRISIQDILVVLPIHFISKIGIYKKPKFTFFVYLLLSIYVVYTTYNSWPK